MLQSDVKTYDISIIRALTPFICNVYPHLVHHTYYLEISQALCKMRIYRVIHYSIACNATNVMIIVVAPPQNSLFEIKQLTSTNESYLV
jgi:hypothetical protein